MAYFLDFTLTLTLPAVLTLTKPDLTHHVRKRGPHVLLSPGRVSDYRIDTILFISGRGNLQSVRYDTVVSLRGERSEARPTGEEHDSDHDRSSLDNVYRFDTIYLLDTSGNLMDKIIIDSTIVSRGTPGSLG